MTVCGQPREAFVASPPLEGPVVAALEKADLALQRILADRFLAGPSPALHQFDADAIRVPEVAPAPVRPARVAEGADGSVEAHAGGLKAADIALDILR